jgi:16S rRNA (cytosine1402-N4)-methyltransferase
MVDAVMEWLRVHPGGVWLDLGCGPGGYAVEMLRRSAPDGKVVALDVDPDMLAMARRRLGKHIPDRCTLVRSNYSRLADVLSELGISQVEGASIDCGVARDQIMGEANKGLSYAVDQPLSMALDPDLPQTAVDLLNYMSEAELRKLFRELGDVRRAGSIAKAIVRRRGLRPVTSTAELAELIDAIDAPPRRRGKIRHPDCPRAFLALRVAVNAELPSLEQGITQAVAHLRPGTGRLVVVSYHGTEDRLVKRTLRALARGCHCPPHLPCTCGLKPQIRVLTQRPIWVSDQEAQANPAARSARLRACEKLASAVSQPPPGGPVGP